MGVEQPACQGEGEGEVAVAQYQNTARLRLLLSIFLFLFLHLIFRLLLFLLLLQLPRKSWFDCRRVTYEQVKYECKIKITQQYVCSSIMYLVAYLVLRKDGSYVGVRCDAFTWYVLLSLFLP